MNFKPFSKQAKFTDAVFSGKFTVIVYGGSIKGGKTTIGLAAIITLCKIYPKSRWAIVRADMPSIDRNIFPEFDKVLPTNFIKADRRFSIKNPHIEFTNGSVLLFFPENYAKDKALNRWKGLNVNGFLLEEMNELQSESFYKAIERAGTWVIPDTDIQPAPLIMGTCNPSLGYVKTLIYDKWEAGTLQSNYCYIPANIFDNPYLSEAYKESLKSLPKYQYQVFVEGNWNIRLKTGGEFFKKFELDEHLSDIKIDVEQLIHISIDANVLPYIAVSIWQIFKKNDVYDICQVHEIPCRDPDNSAFNAGRKVGKWLNDIGYNLKIQLYGDQTTKARNSIDPLKRSFYDLFVLGLKEQHYNIVDKFFRKNPIVAQTGEFINDVLSNRFDHIRIKIDESCSVSISDYIDSKEDLNGNILKAKEKNKKGQSYEKNGHYSDCFRYIVCKAFEPDFKKYKRSSGFKFSGNQFSELDKMY